MENHKKKFIRIKNLALGSSCTERIEDLPDFIDSLMIDAEPAEKWEFYFIEMTEEEYAELPEFIGW